MSCENAAAFAFSSSLCLGRPSNPDPLSFKLWWVSYLILCTYASWVAASRFSAYSTRHSACFFATEFFLMCSSYQNSVGLSYTLMSCTMCKGTRGMSLCTWRWFITQWVEWTMEQKNKVVKSRNLIILKFIRSFFGNPSRLIWLYSSSKSNKRRIVCPSILPVS